MEEEDPIYTKILKVIHIHFTMSLFTKTLLDIIKNLFSYFSILNSFVKELLAYLIL